MTPKEGSMSEDESKAEEASEDDEGSDESSGKSGNFEGGFIVVVLILVGVAIGTVLGKCTCDTCQSPGQIQELVQARAADMLRDMDTRFGEYGVVFPDFPFGNPWQCRVGGIVESGSRDKTDIGYVVDQLRALNPYNGYYGRWKWSSDWEWIEWKYVVRLSPAVLMYIETYRGSPTQFLHTGHVKVCEYADTKCVNDVANNFIE